MSNSESVSCRVEFECERQSDYLFDAALPLVI